jgi:putative FmdB family regulatory protein
MPLYVQVCEKCDRVFEYMVPLEKFEEPIKCPGCGEETKRAMMPVLFKIK